MYSYNDFERLFVRYKAESVPSAISIRKFCDSNKVPYNLFEKWYKDTRSRIVQVQVTGAKAKEPEPEHVHESKLISATELRILVESHMYNSNFFAKRI